jgi:hypothetical protein
VEERVIETALKSKFFKDIYPKSIAAFKNPANNPD